MLLTLISIDALDDVAYKKASKERGVDPEDEDFNKVDPAEFHRECRGPFKPTPSSDWFGDMLPDGWVSADVFNWCTDIMFRDGHGRLIKVATDWGEDDGEFDGSGKLYPVVYTGGDPADVCTVRACADYIKRFRLEIDDWYRMHPERINAEI